MEIGKRRFFKLLSEITRSSFDTNPASIKKDSELLMNSLLDFASETQDNKNCFNNIEYGITQNNDSSIEREVVGFKIKGQNISISELINLIEGIQIPEQVKENYPELNNEQWDACLRLATLIFSSIEKMENDYKIWED